jgi:hypothetical protein
MDRGLEDPRKRGGFIAWAMALAVGSATVYGIYLAIDRTGVLLASMLLAMVVLVGILLFRNKS